MLLSLETSFMFVKVLMRIKYATSDLDDAQLKSKMYFVLQQEVCSLNDQKQYKDQSSIC